MIRTTSLALAGAALLVASPALAQVAAMADTDLNLRSGPGSSYEVVGVIPAQGEVTVTGCMTDTPWCQVDYQGTTAWAFGDYLSTMVNDAPTVILTDREALGIPAVEMQADDGVDTGATDTEAAIGAGTAAAIAAGALIGGPAAIAAAAALGASGGAILNDDDAAVTYVRDNPVEPVILDGEVVVGAGIPEGVTLAPVPDTSYVYAYVNGQPVLVDSASRQIVYIAR